MKHSITVRLFATVLMLIIPLLLLQGGIYAWSHEAVTEEIQDTAISNLRYLQHYLEQKTQDVYDTSDSLVASTIIGQFHSKLAHDSFESTSEYYMLIRDICTTLSLTKYSNELVKELELIFPNKGLIINTQTVAETDAQELAKIYEASNRQNTHLMEIDGKLYSFYIWQKAYGAERSPILLLVELDQEELVHVLSSYSEIGTKSSYFISDVTQHLLASESAFDVSAHELQSLLNELQNADFRQQTLRVGGNSYEAFARYSDFLQFAVIQLIPSSLFNQIPATIGALILLLCLATIVVLINLLSVLRRTVSRPVDGLQRAFEEAGHGNFSVRLPRQRAREFDQLATGFNAMAAHIDKLIDTNYRQTIRLQTAELKKLQAQINPHFLYNSFYFLRHLISTNETESAEEFCRYLGRYFQFITRNDQNTMTLREEYEHAVNYLNIQLMRFGDTVEADVQTIPDELGDLIVPRLIVEPAVENCFKYGLNTTDDTSWISLSFEQDLRTVAIVIENNGDDLTDEALHRLIDTLGQPADKASFTGLVNTHHRLKLFFGEEAGVELERSHRGGLLVRLRITRTPLPRPEEKGDLRP